MSSRDLSKELELADLKHRLVEAQQLLANIKKEIAGETNFETRERLQVQKENLFEKISQLDNKRKAIEEASEQQHLTARVSELTNILKDADDSAVKQAYQALESHWHTNIAVTMPLVSEMVTELERLGNSPTGHYSGLESFIAHLWHIASESLLRQLDQWSQRYYPQKNWDDLYQTIQTELAERAQNFQPAIFVKISLAEEETTQSANHQPHYRLDSWLIEDIDKYKKEGKRRNGFEALIKAETPEAKPFPIETLEDKIQSLLGQWLKRTRPIVMNCGKDPEFYIFLPKELLGSAVDQWPLSASSCLGHTYPVILCCSDRRDYPASSIGGWRQYWERYENAAGRTAKEVFIECDAVNIPAVMTAIETIEDSQDAVGLHLTNAPSVEVLDLIAEELWIAGLPLMFWGRCEEPKIDNAQELDTILRKKSLCELAKTVKTERRQSRSNTPDCHIGHHLSLLRDNPQLIYPLSA